MRLSAPIYALKRKARTLSRQTNLPLHSALDIIAVQEGFNGWSLLMSKTSVALTVDDLFSQLQSGDLVLLGARPQQGKTMLSLELLLSAMKAGRQGAFFTLEYTEHDVQQRFRRIETNWKNYEDKFLFDGSDAISSDYIIHTLSAASEGTVVIIDYLQLLDQVRFKPDLMQQVSALKVFAEEKGLVFVFISQVDRSYDPIIKPMPDIRDIRLPNPLNLSLFNKTCFLHDGKIRFSKVS